MSGRRNKYDMIAVIVNNGGSVTIKCKTRKEFQYLRVYFYQVKGWKVTTNSQALRVKVTRRTT